MALIYVKMAPGLKFRDPATRKHIPDEGQFVDETDPFWDRCLAVGDVARAEPPVEEPIPAPDAAAAADKKTAKAAPAAASE